MELDYNRTPYWVFYCIIYVACLIGFSCYQWLVLDGWAGFHWMATLGQVSSASVGTALLGVILLEGGIYMVLFAPRRIAKLKAQGREEGRREGRTEGRQEVQAALKEWYERFKEAQANNQPFDEPPPFLPGDDRANS